MFNLFGSKKKVVGLDLGASAVKLIVGSMKGTKFSIEEMVLVPLPFRAIDEQGIQDVDTVQNAISTALQQVKLKDPKLGLAMHGASVLTKRIVLPKIPKKEIPTQVRWEAEQVFPQDISTILVDHLLLGEVASLPNAPPGTKGWDLLLVGARQEDVQTLRDVVEGAAGSPALIDLEAFVAGDLIDRQMSFEKKKKFIGLVDIGATATRVSVRGSGSALFMREFPIAGNTFTDVIAQNLGLSFEDAEALKIQGSGEGFPAEAQEALNTIFSQWKAELQQCEDLFISQASDALVSEWYLYGGASLTPGLLDSLGDERFGDRTKLVPFDKHVKAAGRGVDKDVASAWGPRLATAMGLCCRDG